ncbi:thiolproteinase SmTP1, putative [Perkinsus marinus ATCC 50983]|uniref:Thiolproteinase SmTP1, putative n=1 Tax=Perkinsus marinus (strain ATCC 50983 / TXsc) TaxID=423536 RepID=C5LHR5_PERM5|nr:thiolproteinase SmTP1, putative [Perkinsus marinus ATCC 50983]EER03669.1 thiolproteinase SmTP1, putative [Perkinsus marinus ATCC 50983]|eukprot:XP_002771853.1 thiolproteinase SmTP1, putative [Perkinsus marinus ATCC 50983]
MLAFQLLLAVVTAEYGGSQVRDMFEAYKEKFGHNFGAQDDSRMKIFADNLRFIEEENVKGLPYKLKVTPFAHLTNAEFRMTRLATMPKSRSFTGNKANTVGYEGSVEELPAVVNYVAKGWVTDVKDQGYCGSCWAFSTTGALEALHKNHTGDLVPLSEEQLLDCSLSYGNEGCMGGWMINAFEYVADHGIDSEKDYPYEPRSIPSILPIQFPCQHTRTAVIAPHSTRYVNVTSSKPALLAAIALSGPVSVAIDAGSRAFQHYGGGVLNSTCYTSLNHGVLAVGYDLKAIEPYYLVKNSWGATWGDKGYIKMAIDDSPKGICGILLAASYPIAA